MKFRVGVALFALIAFTTLSASAQMSESERKAAARAAYSEGVTLQDKGNPAEALGRFEAAQRLFDAPTHLLHIAECQALTGKLVEASETYETLIRKPLGKDAPDAFVQAQEQGKAELAALRPRIPTMRVTVKPEPESLQNLQIGVNDKQMPVELVGIARPVNPGSYRITASATGWGTAAPVEIEVKEKEPRSVELVLEQGKTGGAVVVGPVTTPEVAAVPPPYEQATPKPKPAARSPSPAGLLLGVRPGVFIPFGEVTKNRNFDEFGTAGPGLGLDVVGRLARVFLLGGTLELATLGAPEASKYPAGTRAEVGTHTIYAGVLAGIMPNVDRVTFVADAGVGMRYLSRTLTLTATDGSSAKADESYSGLELAINAGLSIPAGPVRIVPKAGLAFGQFSDRNCALEVPTTTTITGCGASTVATASHTIVNLVVGLYYHVDFSKKPGSASSSRFFTTAAAR